MWALGLGMGLSSIAFSLRYRLPVLTAWSTPGAALIAASGGISLPEVDHHHSFTAIISIRGRALTTML
mgnify:CR=1 FL=1